MATKEEMVKEAREAFLSGCNCAQSTAVPFADCCGITKDAMLKLASGLGGGVAGLKQTCGIVTGMALVIGMKKGSADPKDADNKAMVKNDLQALANEFVSKFDSTLCAELTAKLEKDPVPSVYTGEFYEQKPCMALVETGVGMIYDYLNA